ncbi:MAG: hypothetical protein AAGD01_20785 [Acidobacteriota bacterium]
MSKKDWSNVLSQWLSPEPGKGPPEDDAWRKESGFLQPFNPSGGKANTTASKAPEPSAEESSMDWDFADPDNYDSERRAFHDEKTAFIQRLMYSFPNVQNLSADQLTLAAGWVTDMEAKVLAVREKALEFAVFGLNDFLNEVNSAMQELAQLRQGYAAQKRRIEQEQRARIAEINRQAEAHARSQREERRKIWRQTQDEINAMRKETKAKRDRMWEKSNEEFLRYIRGEKVIGYVKVIDD